MGPGDYRKEGYSGQRKSISPLKCLLFFLSILAGYPRAMFLKLSCVNELPGDQVQTHQVSLPTEGESAFLNKLHSDAYTRSPL